MNPSPGSLGDGWELVSQGAEARVYALRDATGRALVAKHRFAKAYRTGALDARLRKERLLQEVRCLARCRSARIDTPAVLMVDTARHLLYLERVPGQTVRDFVESRAGSDPAAVAAVMRHLGAVIARIHDLGMTHGDLTTSNFMARPTPGDGAGVGVCVIDFGLGSLQASPEDKAVDLYVLDRAISSTHDESGALLDTILDAYRAASPEGEATLKRLDAVRLRGRKRDCFG